MLNGKIQDFFEIGSGNSGLTEKIIYLNQPKSKKTTVKVFSASTKESTSMACVDERALLNKGNKLVKLKIYKGEGIIISRKGKAGNLLYVDEEKYTLNDDAYTLRVKSKYVKDISLKYVLYTMRKWTELCVIS